jgi:hypothetical protein
VYGAGGGIALAIAAIWLIQEVFFGGGFVLSQLSNKLFGWPRINGADRQKTPPIWSVIILGDAR